MLRILEGRRDAALGFRAVPRVRDVMTSRTFTHVFRCGALALCVSSPWAARAAVVPHSSSTQESTPTASPEIPHRERERPRDEKALFALFAASPGLEVAYEEEKHLGLLAAPLSSRGRLYFLPPEHLTRKVVEPEPSSVLITSRSMRMVSRGVEKRIDLSSSPELKAFILSLSRVFAGEREGLAGSWAIQYEFPADEPRAWTLKLTPRKDVAGHEALARMVASLELGGEGQSVLRIEVREPNGDRTVTRISKADPARVFSEREKADLFGIVPATPAAIPRGDGGR